MKDLDPRKFRVSCNGTVELTDYGLKCAMEAYFDKFGTKDKAMTPSQPVSTPRTDALCSESGGPIRVFELAELARSLERSLREAVELLAARDKTIKALREDAKRLDWLEAERTDMPGTLFRSNRRITRAAIDSARIKDGTKP